MRLGSRRITAATLVVLFLLAPLISSTSAGMARSTTVWSGNVSLPDGYLVESNQVLVIQAGTTVLLGDGERLGVDGRLTVEGTSSSPVTFGSISGDHQGIQFNSSSSNMGSVLDNVTITDSEFGITIYSSNPTISNLTVLNADRVAVDLFSGASPRINDLVIDGGGQDIHGTSLSWRYGIGISAGDFSSPIVRGAHIENLVTRGVNMWYNSGGLWSDISIHNVSGSTLAPSSGIWVEDSIPLFTNSNVSRSDNGIIVRHISDDSTTRPTFLDTKVEDSQYRGVLVERQDHSNFSNLETNAVFESLEIRGTGGPNAKTPGLGIGAAFDLNTSGARVSDAIIEGNAIVGFRAYTTDSSTHISNLTIRDNGPQLPASFHDGAGLLFRSTSWTGKGPAEIHGLSVQNSSGSGVVMAKGGVIGSNWTISDNSGDGASFVEFHPRVENLLTERNYRHGLSVIDSSNVELSQIQSFQNGLASSEGAGLYFQGSNYVMSGGKNVSCNSCSSNGDHSGLVVRDSIDVQLTSITVVSSVSEPAVDIDNSGTIFPGNVIIDDMMVDSDSSNYSVMLNQVDANISGLDLSGEGGMFWEAKGTVTSHLSNSVIWDSPSHCLDLRSHTELIVVGTTLICDASAPTLDNSIANFTASSLDQDAGASSSFEMNSSSHLRWISSGPLLTPENTEDDNILDVMWSMEVHTINQNLLNIPFANVNISFSQFDDDLDAIQPYQGVGEYGPFVGKRWTPLQGWSENNSAFVGCEYDSVHNDTAEIVIDDDKTVYCRMELSNQPPFIQWSSPLDEEQFSSGSEIQFDAIESWDLDFDALTFSWTSSIDGDLALACPESSNGNHSSFIANFNGSGCLSDGNHQVTLEVCDSQGQCTNETREIELVNLPPVLSVKTTPSISSWGVLFLGETASLTVSLNGTFDPEGADLWCWVEASYESGPDPDPNSPFCQMEIVRSFIGAPEEEFTASVFAFDGVNPAVSWTFEVNLFNEIPEPVMGISRTGESSADWVHIDGTGTSDPEGDEVRFEFHSDIDGLLASGTSTSGSLEWMGTLSKGTHKITMKSSDDQPEHVGQWKTSEETLIVSNSVPNARISSPADSLLTDSSEVILLGATGSGDWDLYCGELPSNGSGLLCNPDAPSSSELVSVIWESNISEAPLGGSWNVETRLPAGDHEITLTLDDGSGPVQDQVFVTVTESAPVLVLDSPVPGIEVTSNLPVLFDFRPSIDYDGDEFTVSVSSDLMGTILEDKTSDNWYNDYLVAGMHNLTFVLEDDNGMVRTHFQEITVLETAPVAVISGMDNGQYLPPGQMAILSAEDSIDYDGDIVLYEWRIDGEVVSDSMSFNQSFPPGPVRIDLMVKDSRGDESITSINLTVGSSSPELFDLTVSVQRVEDGVPTEVTTTVRLEDEDGTTQTVRGELLAGGASQVMFFQDDGTRGDAVAGDGIWSSRSSWVVSGGDWARVEVWAIDGDLVSPGQVHTVPIVEPSSGGLEAWVSSFGIPTLVISIAGLSIAGLFYRRRSLAEIAKDIEVIESWSTFDPREMDEQFDSQED